MRGGAAADALLGHAGDADPEVRAHVLRVLGEAEVAEAIPAARGEAERTIRAAEGYALNRVNRAKGNADRFVALYNEYIKAQDITKRRLYLETIQQTFPNLGHKYIVDSDQKNLLPLLNLGQSLNPVQQSSGEK